MQEELTTLVECIRHLCHVFSFHDKLLSTPVVFHVSKVARLWDNDMAAAESPVEKDLCFRASILQRKLLNQWLLREIVAFRTHLASKSPERTVRNWLDLMIKEELDEISLSAARVQADLIADGLVACISHDI